jgi:hypothetical protein
LWGSVAHGEHDTCITAVPNEGRLNRVFKLAGVPYGPRLEPGSEASKNAARKRRNDAGAGPAGKCAKVSGRKAMATKAPKTPKGMGASSSKAAPSKSAPSHTKSVPTAGATVRASVLPNVGAPAKAIVPKITVMPVVPKAGLLRISTGLKGPSAEPSQVPKGKQAKVDVAPSPACAPIHRAILRL